MLRAGAAGVRHAARPGNGSAGMAGGKSHRTIWGGRDLRGLLAPTSCRGEEYRPRDPPPARSRTPPGKFVRERPVRPAVSAPRHSPSRPSAAAVPGAAGALKARCRGRGGLSRGLCRQARPPGCPGGLPAAVEAAGGPLGRGAGPGRSSRGGVEDGGDGGCGRVEGRKACLQPAVMENQRIRLSRPWDLSLCRDSFV